MSNESTTLDAAHTPESEPTEPSGQDVDSKSAEQPGRQRWRLRLRRRLIRASRGAHSNNESRSPDPKPARQQRRQTAVITIVSIAAMIAALVSGYLKYEQTINADTARARSDSLRAAEEATVALLSYTPQNAQAQLTAAADLLTGTFHDSYTSLTRDVVIPGAQQKQISATASVAAAASVTATPEDARVVVFINQSTVMAAGAPTQTASVVEISLTKYADRWLVSGFEPK
ncbi:hypothetical protein ACWDTP_15260 [Mycobacterium sp. NPDC003449]